MMTEVQTNEAAKYVVDAVSAGSVVAMIFGWLPAMCAVLTIIWTLIRIWETKTVQSWFKRKP